MPPEENPSPGSPQDWLKHALSDFYLGKEGQNEFVLFDTLCFHFQQAGEKALKALLISKNISFPKTHNLNTLFKLLPVDMEIPETIKKASRLTEFSVAARYPVGLEPATEEEYNQALKLAENLVSWVRKQIQN